MLGVVLVDKKPGITSHDVVARVRRLLKTKRVGHAGTLDPMATGLLVIAVGPATRFLQFLPLEPKEYDCWFRFGMTTETYDLEGEQVETKPVPSDLEAQIADALPQFRGEIAQLPPMYSAVKKAGQPLYVYARKGEEVEREPRHIYIEKYEMGDRDENDIHFRVVCSGGTYVRSLAHDLGQAIGCGAVLSEIRRTRVGGFRVEDAISEDDVTPDALIPLAEALPPMPLVRLNPSQVMTVQNGQPVRLRDVPPEERVAMTDSDGTVLGVALTDGDWLQPEVVIPREALTPGF